MAVVELSLSILLGLMMKKRKKAHPKFPKHKSNSTSPSQREGVKNFPPDAEGFSEAFNPIQTSPYSIAEEFVFYPWQKQAMKYYAGCHHKKPSAQEYLQ
jgi:hypothetical protein